MRHPHTLLIAALIASFIVESRGQDGKPFDPSNPFYAPSKLPFQAPEFDKIRNEDFKPAVEEGIRIQGEEVQKIAGNADAPSFENTFIAMEKSGQLLKRALWILTALNSSNTNAALQKTDQEMAPKVAANADAIYLNTALFKRVEKIFEKRNQLSPEDRRLTEFYYQKFVLAGAQLDDSAKERLKKMNQEEATLKSQFNTLLIGAAKASEFVITERAELSGLSAEAIQACALNAKNSKQDGKWVIVLQNTTQQPELQNLTNRSTRQNLFEKSWLRAERNDAFDTRALIARLAQLRAQKAKLIGYSTYTELKLQDQMAKTPLAVEQFLGKLTPAALAKARQETADIQALIDRQQGGFKLEASDWNFYAEQVRKQRFDIDENETKPYLEINNVLQNGVFYAANLLYGISFKERKDLPVYQQDVRVFDVIDKDGSPLALFYCDYYKRDNKKGGAWMSNFVGQSKLLGTKPVIYNVCNFTKPAPGQPELITWSNMRTMFHEFGHALHGLFSDQRYPSLSGTSTSRDFVEFPSQFNEHWATDPKVLPHFAVHYQTGAPIPQSLIDKINMSATFNQGYNLIELIAADNIDLQWHMLDGDAPLQDVDKFEREALEKSGLALPQIPPRYRSSYFSHIWGSAYAAGYYAYLWAEMLGHDAFAWFEEHGGLSRANGDRFREMILSKGNGMELGKMYVDFRGRQPQIEPLLKFRGLQ